MTPPTRLPPPPVLFLVLALLAGGCSGDRSGTVEVGERVPAYAAPNLAGDTVSFRSLRGDPFLLNVWATWCTPCRDEMPELQALEDRYEDRGLRVIGVSVDRTGTEESIRSFLEETGVDYTILRDPRERISNLFSIYGLPATFLVDGEGTLVWHRIGPLRADEAELANAVEKTLRGR